jgi:hypothetical protein
LYYAIKAIKAKPGLKILKVISIFISHTNNSYVEGPENQAMNLLNVFVFTGIDKYKVYLPSHLWLFKYIVRE